MNDRKNFHASNFNGYPSSPRCTAQYFINV